MPVKEYDLLELFAMGNKTNLYYTFTNQCLKMLIVSHIYVIIKRIDATVICIQTIEDVQHIFFTLIFSLKSSL